MSYWIEVRCSKQTASKCYSARQVDTPMMLTRGATVAAINLAALTLSTQAEKLGWRMIDKGWVCPECNNATNK